MKFDFSFRNEIWKPVRAFPGYYVSDQGRMASTRIARRGRLIKLRRDKDGYATCQLFRWPQPYQFRFARLLLETFVGNPPDPSYQAAHEDGNKHNDKLNNLSWKTRKENEHDKIRHGTHRNGGMAGAVLTEELVTALRKERKEGMVWAKLAEKYGVNSWTIRDACEGRTWKHLP